jgi:hypothetical protein
MPVTVKASILLGEVHAGFLGSRLARVMHVGMRTSEPGEITFLGRASKDQVGHQLFSVTRSLN